MKKNTESFDQMMAKSGAVKNEFGQWIHDGKVVGLDMTMFPSNDKAKEIITNALTALGMKIPDELK